MRQLHTLIDTPILWAIYGLRTTDSPEYRYVGLTRVGLDKRLETHKRDARVKNKKSRYVLQWIAKNYENVVIDLLEECPIGDDTYLYEAEIFWITQIRGFGHSLTNLSDGGASGSYGSRWKLREDQIRRGENHPLFGSKMPEAHKEKLASIRRGTRMSPESRAKMSASRSGEKHWAYGGGKFSDEHRANISKAVMGRKLSAETRAKMSETRRGVKMSPEAIEKSRIARTGLKRTSPAWNKGLPNPSAHIRWHTNKNVSKPETCNFCKEETNDP